MADPSFVDHAVPVLSAASELDDTQRANLHDVFHGSRDPNELAQALQTIPVPDDVKHKLYDAKKLSMPTADPVEKGIAVINRIGQIPAQTLEVAEKYPKLVSTLIGLAAKDGDEGKPSKEGKTPAKRPVAAPADIPATPPGHSLILDSVGGLHHVPSANIEKARAIDPHLTVLHSEPDESEA